jgi:hypothetical protein
MIATSSRRRLVESRDCIKAGTTPAVVPSGRHACKLRGQQLWTSCKRRIRVGLRHNWLAEPLVRHISVLIRAQNRALEGKFEALLGMRPHYRNALLAGGGCGGYTTLHKAYIEV